MHIYGLQSEKRPFDPGGQWSLSGSSTESRRNPIRIPSYSLSTNSLFSRPAHAYRARLTTVSQPRRHRASAMVPPDRAAAARARAKRKFSPDADTLRACAMASQVMFALKNNTKFIAHLCGVSGADGDLTLIFRSVRHADPLAPRIEGAEDRFDVPAKDIAWMNPTKRLGQRVRIVKPNRAACERIAEVIPLLAPLIAKQEKNSYAAVLTTGSTTPVVAAGSDTTVVKESGSVSNPSVLEEAPAGSATSNNLPKPADVAAVGETPRNIEDAVFVVRALTESDDVTVVEPPPPPPPKPFYVAVLVEAKPKTSVAPAAAVQPVAKCATNRKLDFSSASPAKETMATNADSTKQALEKTLPTPSSTRPPTAIPEEYATESAVVNAPSLGSPTAVPEEYAHPSTVVNAPSFHTATPIAESHPKPVCPPAPHLAPKMKSPPQFALPPPNIPIPPWFMEKAPGPYPHPVWMQQQGGNVDLRAMYEAYGNSRYGKNTTPHPVYEGYGNSPAAHYFTHQGMQSQQQGMHQQHPGMQQQSHPRRQYRLSFVYGRPPAAPYNPHVHVPRQMPMQMTPPGAMHAPGQNPAAMPMPMNMQTPMSTRTPMAAPIPIYSPPQPPVPMLQQQWNAGNILAGEYGVGHPGPHAPPPQPYHYAPQ